VSGGVRRSLAALSLLAGVAVLAVPLAGELSAQRIGAVRVTGEFQRLSRDELEAAVRAELAAGGFFAVDVERVRAAARMLPWVREATVRRVWPDSIHIAVQERVAVARWNERALMEDDATLFRPLDGVEGHSLPRLYGPRGREREVLEQFKRLAVTFGTVAGGVSALWLSERGGWRVRFSSGLTLVPRTPLDEAELARVAQALPRILGERLDQAARIDLRYANGFAVRWRDPQVSGEERL
jgi:cell division protein FtsQ